MNRRIAGVLFSSISLGLFAPNVESQQAAPVKPPIAPVRPVTDDYYGTKVVDDYRYMENLNDPEVQAWFKNQDAYTRAQAQQALADSWSVLLWQLGDPAFQPRKD